MVTAVDAILPTVYARPGSAVSRSCRTQPLLRSSEIRWALPESTAPTAPKVAIDTMK